MNDLSSPNDDDLAPPRALSRSSAERMLRVQPVELDVPPSEGPPGISASAVLHAVRRNWLLGSVLGILCAVPLAAVAWIVVQPKFEATTLIRMSPQHVPLAFPTADRSPAPGHLEFRNFKNTQRQLLLSPQLLSSALKHKDVAELPDIKKRDDPILWLQDRLDISFPDDAEIMQIGLKLADGDGARKIIDAIVETYYKEVVLDDQNDRLRRIDNLERVRADAENKARARRAELQGLVDTLGTSDSSTMTLAQQAALQQYSLIRTELMKTRFDLMRAEGELQGLPPESDDPSSDAQSAFATLRAEPASQIEMKVAQLLESDPIGARNLHEVRRYTDLIQQAKDRLSPEAAEQKIARYEERLAEAERNLLARHEELRESLAETELPMLADTRRADLSREIEVLKLQERQLEEELNAQEQESKKFGRSSIDAEMMLQEVDGLDKVVAGITDELERTKIELNSKSRITILGPAQTPQVGDAKKRLPLTAAAGLFGLFVPMTLLLLFDLRRRPVNGRETMTEVMRMPVLGSLPRVPKRALRRTSNNPRSRAGVWSRRLEESVAAITSLLLHKLDLEGHRIVLVTSAASGEGKSTLATQLAASLAESGHATLLIDFDLRRPMLHRYFDLPVQPGVSDVLRGGMELEEAAQATELPNLRLLTAGNRRRGSLLQDASNGSLKALFATARANYEIVLVDSCPMLPVMDGRLVGQYADGAILSVVKDVSQLPQITSACGIMADYGIPTLGCVVMGESDAQYRSDYAVPELEPTVAV